MIFDLEADGLLEEATKLHVMAYTDGNRVRHTHDYEEMRSLFRNARVLIGHNITRYDIPLVERLLGIKIEAQIIDTLALSWYLNHTRVIHGLESYGEEFGVPKPEIDNWQNLTPEEYSHRCKEDVKINRLLWNQLKNKLLRLYGDKDSADRFLRYLQFKMDCAAEQERSGWKLDVDLAQKSYDELLEQETEKLEELKLHMPHVPVYVKKTKPKKPYKKDGTYSSVGANWFRLLKEHNLPKDYDGEVKVQVGEKEPNPGSHAQIKDWLFSMGWEPQTFDYKRDKDTFEERAIPQVRVDTGEGKELCPSVLELAEKEPAIRVLEGLSIIQHRITIFNGFLKNHKNGWLKAEINGLANTLRFKHKVIVNLPGVSKAWGKEVRGCLIAPEGQILCGSDMSSLEDTTKRHYMYDYDPEYVEEMSRPGFDPHLDLAKFAGVVSQEEIDAYVNNLEGAKNLKPIRTDYKTVNYSATYGVKPPKLSRTIGCSRSKAEKLLNNFWKRNWAIQAVVDSLEVKTINGEMWLLNPVSKFYYSLRYEKDKFSTLNQGTGVYCFDTWIREFRKKRSQLTGQFHDEIIACIKEGQEDRYEKLLRDSIQKVNEKLKLNVKLDIDVQFGKTYAEIH